MGFIEDWFDEDEVDSANELIGKMRKKLHDSGYTFARFKKEYLEHFPKSELDEDGFVEQFDNCAIAMYTVKGIESFNDWIELIKSEHEDLLLSDIRKHSRKHNIPPMHVINHLNKYKK